MLLVHNNGSVNIDSVQWVVQTYELELSACNIFYFEGSWNGPRFFSHYFNITDDAITSPRATTSSATSSQSSKATTAWLSSTSAWAAPTISSPSLGTSGTSNGLSQTTKVGLGVGLSIGVPLILLLGILVGTRLTQSRANRTRSQITYSSKPSNSFHPEGSAPQQNERRAFQQRHANVNGTYEMPHEHGLCEVSACHGPYEIAAGPAPSIQ